MSIYKIPLNYKAGKFPFSELHVDKADECLNLDYDTEYQMLEYKVPVYEGEATIYTVPRELILDGLTAVYDSSGKLERVELAGSERTRLIYIRFRDFEESKEAVLQFAQEQAEQMCAVIADRKQTLARLFLGTYTCGGPSIQIAAITGTAEEMQAVIDQYRGDLDTADNSGNYPLDTNMIELDRESLGVMLMCSCPDCDNTLFALAAAVVVERIKRHLLNEIDKTADFKFILEEWD